MGGLLPEMVPVDHPSSPDASTTITITGNHRGEIDRSINHDEIRG